MVESFLVPGYEATLVSGWTGKDLVTTHLQISWNVMVLSVWTATVKKR